VSKPLFIAISGKKGSGKDQFAQFLATELVLSNYEVAITHFADPLKEICIKLFGLNPKFVYGSNADKEQPTSVLWDGFPLEVRKKYCLEEVRDNFTSRDPHFGDLKPVPRTGPMTHRELLQVMGTDIFRERVYNNVWAEYPFKQEWATEYAPVDVVFIADCRFPNEVEETLKNMGLVIRISRDTGHNDNHPSETALDKYDFTQVGCTIVNNNGTLNELAEEAKKIAKLIWENL